MNRKILSLGIAALALIGAVPARSQSAPSADGAAATVAKEAKEEKLPTPDELSEKCAKGSGGKDAWAKLNTMIMKGTVDITTFGVSGTIEVFAKRPNKILRTTNMMDGQFVQKQGFDGKAGWENDSQKGLRAITGEQLEQVKVEAIFDADAHLKEVYPDLKVTGRTKVGDRDAYIAVAHETGSKTLTMYFDAQTGVRIAEDTEGPDESGTVVKANLLFEDYRAAGDVQVPHTIRVKAPNVSLVIKIDDVKLNEPVDDTKFAMPAAN